MCSGGDEDGCSRDAAGGACDGGGGVLGHPKIYLEMGAASEVVSPYCSRRFVFKESTAVNAGDLSSRSASAK